MKQKCNNSENYNQTRRGNIQATERFEVRNELSGKNLKEMNE